MKNIQSKCGPTSRVLLILLFCSSPYWVKSQGFFSCTRPYVQVQYSVAHGTGKGNYQSESWQWRADVNYGIQAGLARQVRQTKLILGLNYEASHINTPRRPFLGIVFQPHTAIPDPGDEQRQHYLEQGYIELTRGYHVRLVQASLVLGVQQKLGKHFAVSSKLRPAMVTKYTEYAFDRFDYQQWKDLDWNSVNENLGLRGVRSHNLYADISFEYLARKHGKYIDLGLQASSSLLSILDKTWSEKAVYLISCGFFARGYF